MYFRSMLKVFHTFFFFLHFYLHINVFVVYLFLLIIFISPTMYISLLTGKFVLCLNLAIV